MLVISNFNAMSADCKQQAPWFWRS